MLMEARVVSLTGVALSRPGFRQVALPYERHAGEKQVFACPTIGVLGEYVGRIYKEVKQRPGSVVKAVTNPGENQGETNR